MNLSARWPVALITGASSGIGRAFAVALATRGCDLVVVARRADRLQELAAEITASSKRSVEVMVADLTNRSERATVEARLADSGRPVDLLINNAGVGGSGPFNDQTADHEEGEILLNVVAPARLTSAVLPGMIERRRGGIINVSSIAGVQAVPYLATYAATKAYLTSFSQALHEEVRSQGVTVVALLPGMTHTEFHAAAGLDRSNVPGPAWLSAEEVVESGLRALERGRAIAVPRVGYQVFVGLSRVTPWVVNRRLAAIVGRKL
ncbi:MAG: SDR family NAD(P)-dependent oxidoreductase [Pseudonocardiaceae bacterium]